MKDGIIIGIDAGTSVIKSVAFSVNGQQLAVAAVTNTYESLSNGGVEQDAGRTWRDTATTLKQLTEKIPNLSKRLRAIAVTGQGDGTWLVDKHGEPTAPAWLWLDSRAATIAAEFIKHPNYPAHYQRTGTGVNACQMSIQLAWLAHNQPEILDRSAHAFHCKDWLYFKLTGHAAADPSEANFTFGNFRDRQYQADILDDLGLVGAKRLLCPIVEGTTTSHTLSADAAKLCDLKQGTPIILGYVDVICTGLGGGLFDPHGQTGCTIVGSTGMHMRMVPNASNVKLNDARSGYTMCFPQPNTVAQIQSNMASTLNIDWLLDLARQILMEQGVKRSRANFLKSMDDKILDRRPSQIIYHPYISAAGERGPFMDANAKAMFTGLDTTHGYFDLMRAVFEGLSFAARDCYSAMGEIPQEIRITGGASRSKALLKILASVLNTDIRKGAREEAGAAGAAMMACVQQKIYPDMASCAAKWVDPFLTDLTHPDKALTKIYDLNFSNYVNIRKIMLPIWNSMKLNHDT